MRRRSSIVVFLGALLLALVVWRIRPWTETREPPREARDTTSERSAATEVLRPAEVRTEEGSRSVEPSSAAEPVESVAFEPTPAPPSESEHVSIHGRVLDEQGRPIEASYLTVAARDDRGASFRAKDSDAGDGAYEIRGMAAGSYWVSARAPGWEGEPRRVQLVSDSDSIRVDLALTRSAVVLVRARTPSGEPFRSELETLDAAAPGPTVVVSRDAPTGAWLDPSTADAASYRSVDEQAGHDADVLGELELHQDPPLHVSLMLGHLRVATERLEPFAQDVAFVVDVAEYAAALSSLRFRLVDAASGVAIPHAMVSLATTGVASSTMVPVKEDGRVHFPCVTPGPALLTIVAPRFEELNRPLEIPPGEDVDLGTVEVIRAARLTGRVAGGEGAANLQVFLHSTEGLSRSAHQSVVFTTAVDETRTFDLPFRSGGNVLWAEAELDGVAWRSRAHLVDAKTLVGPVVLELEATVPLLVRSSRPGEDRRASVLEASGLPIGLGGSLGGGPVRFDVLPGAHRLVLEAPSGTREERPVDVGPGGLELDLD